MRKTRVFIATGCCLFAVAIFTWAQASRKAGLWEMTSTMTWQQSPMPPGMNMPAGANNPFGGGPRTTQVCITQAMIDKYGAPMPQNRECQISNVAIKANSMTADWVCTGRMAGKGTVQSTWTDSDHSTSKVHFIGSMQMGPNSKTVEYTMESTATYKGSDCGNVKPVEMPTN
jgi:hypothetical protein